jgi:four helix bundle protein
MQNHRQLKVYGEARSLALQVYSIVATLPSTERFDLARQMRRAAVSVGSNIAEGCGRSTNRDLCSFLDIALGSAAELEFQLDLCASTLLAPEPVVAPALEASRRVQRMLTSLIVRIRSIR